MVGGPPVTLRHIKGVEAGVAHITRFTAAVTPPQKPYPMKGGATSDGIRHRRASTSPELPRPSPSPSAPTPEIDDDGRFLLLEDDIRKLHANTTSKYNLSFLGLISLKLSCIIMPSTLSNATDYY
uniref:Uncharacterized protein n=1 Tax=Oryza brachyantha TaxID=4533 RepID=J3MX95_ORYBR